MKYKVYFGVSLTVTLVGYLLMYALLASENKLDNPKAMSELWSQGSIFGIFGVIMAVVAAKGYARWGAGSMSFQTRVRLRVMALSVFGVLGLLVLGFLNVTTNSGLLTREQAPPAALIFLLLVGCWGVQREPEVFVAPAQEPERSPEVIAEEVYQRMISEGEWSEEEKKELRQALFDSAKSTKA